MVHVFRPWVVVWGGGCLAGSEIWFFGLASGCFRILFRWEVGGRVLSTKHPHPYLPCEEGCTKPDRNDTARLKSNLRHFTQIENMQEDLISQKVASPFCSGPRSPGPGVSFQGSQEMASAFLLASSSKPQACAVFWRASLHSSGSTKWAFAFQSIGEIARA